MYFNQGREQKFFAIFLFEEHFSFVLFILFSSGHVENIYKRTFFLFSFFIREHFLWEHFLWEHFFCSLFLRTVNIFQNREHFLVKCSLFLQRTNLMRTINEMFSKIFLIRLFSQLMTAKTSKNFQKLLKTSQNFPCGKLRRIPPRIPTFRFLKMFSEF